MNKSSDFSELDVIGELVEFDDVMKRCQGIAGLTRAVGWAGGQGVLRGVGLQGTREFRGWAYRVPGMQGIGLLNLILISQSRILHDYQFVKT